MIQRIQTVYLVLGAAALGAMFFFQDMFASNAASTYAWFEPAMIVLIGLSAAAGLGSVFLYSNRKLQRKVVVAAQVLTALCMLALYGGYYLGNELVLRTEAGTDWNRTIMLLLPIVGYVLFFLARRAIQKDIELVQSMDRLR